MISIYKSKEKDKIILADRCDIFLKINVIRGICIYHDGIKGKDYGKFNKFWVLSNYEEIPSVTLNNLDSIRSKSNIIFQKTVNKWIRFGEYLINGNKILGLEQFLIDYDIPISVLKLEDMKSITFNKKINNKK